MQIPCMYYTACAFCNKSVPLSVTSWIQLTGAICADWSYYFSIKHRLVLTAEMFRHSCHEGGWISATLHSHQIHHSYLLHCRMHLISLFMRYDKSHWNLSHYHKPTWVLSDCASKKMCIYAFVCQWKIQIYYKSTSSFVCGGPSTTCTYCSKDI